MMTREQYMLQKQEIEGQMKRTRIAEKRETAAINDEYELRLRDLSDAYRRQRKALFEERGQKRLEIENHYKDERRSLLVKDCELVSQWRAQLLPVNTLPAEENENRSVGTHGGLSNRHGGQGSLQQEGGGL